MKRWLLIVIVLGGCASSPEQQNNAANNLVRQGVPQKALAGYQAAQVAEPDNALYYLNAAQAYALSGDTARAIQTYQQAVLRGSPSQQAAAYYNLGNLYLDGKQPEAAISAYQQALLLDSTLEDARYNLEYALSLIQIATPTPIEMQANPDSGRVDPTSQPTPIPGAGLPPTPSPTPEDPSGPTPENGGQSGDNVSDSRSTPVTQIEGELDVEAARRLLMGQQFEQDNIGLPLVFPTVAPGNTTKDW